MQRLAMAENIASVSRFRIHVNRMRGRMRIAIQTWSDMSASKAAMKTCIKEIERTTSYCDPPGFSKAWQVITTGNN